MTDEPARDGDLDALFALDALGTDERPDVDDAAVPIPPELTRTAAALAEIVATAPPEGLRSDTFAAALVRRPAGRSIDAAVPCSPIAAYRGAADDLHNLLSTLNERDWNAPAHERHGPVRDVVAHLVGIERLVLSWLGAGPVVDPETVVDHVETTRSVIDTLAAADPTDVAQQWYQLTRDVETACRAAQPGLHVLAHDLPTDVDGLLVLRTFELWAHTHDVAIATDRLRPPLDPARLALMSSRLMAALPFALALRGTTRPAQTARIVLTGPAGGCYDVPLDPAQPSGEPDVTIVADTVDVCLVAARRLPPAELDAHVEGDADLARLVLAATDAFARD